MDILWTAVSQCCIVFSFREWMPIIQHTMPKWWFCGLCQWKLQMCLSSRTYRRRLLSQRRQRWAASYDYRVETSESVIRFSIRIMTFCILDPKTKFCTIVWWNMVHWNMDVHSWLFLLIIIKYGWYSEVIFLCFTFRLWRNYPAEFERWSWSH